MTKLALRRYAIELRKQGKTFTEIKQIMNVSKGTLSVWLNSFELTLEQMQLIKENKNRRKYLTAEKIRRIKQHKKIVLYNNLLRNQRKKLLPLTSRENYLIGLFLYWGEGTKGLNSAVSITNTDPKMLKFFIYWLTDVLKVSKAQIKAVVHLYKDMSVDSCLRYWSNELDLPMKQFIKPYIKVSLRDAVDHKGFGKGTCSLYVYNAKLKRQIITALDAISS